MLRPKTMEQAVKTRGRRSQPRLRLWIGVDLRTQSFASRDAVDTKSEPRLAESCQPLATRECLKGVSRDLARGHLEEFLSTRGLASRVGTWLLVSRHPSVSQRDTVVQWHCEFLPGSPTTLPATICVAGTAPDGSSSRGYTKEPMRWRPKTPLPDSWQFISIAQ